MKTFLDASLLIAAHRGDPGVRARALAILDDGKRAFVTSDFVRLEVVPKAIYHKNDDEVAFYELILEASESVEASRTLVLEALAEATTHGLSALDSLHIAAAKQSGCVDLYTAERPEKPLFRADGVRVVSVR